MKQIAITLICLIHIHIAWAQPGTKITGYVKDKAGKGLADVNIMILNAHDSSLVKADISNETGHYEIVLDTGGKFLARFSGTGFSTVMKQGIDVTPGRELTLPDIVLATGEAELQSVTVSAKKPMIEVKADKIVFNVENSINATGSTAFELLRKSPGVMVDNNDNISIKGKNGVRIYVDGRQMYLDTKSLAAYLKSINSNDIEAIEMISNPGAKYEASGNAGIINIRLRKNKKFGTNGSVSVGLVEAIHLKENGSLNLNYRDRKVNIFANVSASGGKYQDGMDLKRIQKDTLYDQRAVNTSNNFSTNLKTGADFFLNRKNTIGIMATGSFDNTDWMSNSTINISDNATGTYVKKLVANNHIPGNRTNDNLNLNYKYADTNGTEVNVDADYGMFRGRGHSLQPNNYYDINDVLIYSITNKNSTPTDIDIYTFKVDAERTLGKGKLGFGGKLSSVSTGNTLDFYEVNNGTDIKLLDKSNSFAYTENVNAAYVSYSQQLSGQWSLQAGLRTENTNSKGVLTRADGILQPDNSVSKSYTDLFPSAALTWNISKSHSLNLTYSRRIDRPTYQDLNPFESKIDELTYEKGNAFLRPQYTNSVELTHTFMGFLNTTAGYSKVSDFATLVTDTIGNAGYVQQQNIATQQIASFNIGSPLPIAKWWNGYVNFWFSYQMFEGKIGTNNVKIDIPLYGGFMQHTFTLGSGYSAEISGWYSGPGIWGGTWRTQPMGSLDAGMQKKLFKDNGNLKLSATDIFFTSGWKSVNDFGGVHIKGRGYWESKALKLTFTYRFGSSTVKNARDRKTGLESEASRIKSGK